MKGESVETSSDPPAIERTTDTERFVNKDSVRFVVHQELQNERVVYKNEHHVRHFTQELMRQRKSGVLCDVIIEVDGERCWAHRAILAAGSAYFHAAFHGDSSRADYGDRAWQVQHLHLTTVDKTAFESVMCYIYSGELLVSLTTVNSLITAADQLGVADVKLCCALHMQKNMDINNWLDIYKTCVAHNLENLSTIVEDFVGACFGVLAQEMELLQLPESNLQRILTRCNAERDSDIEAYILQVILKWVAFSYTDRVSSLDSLLDIVNTDILSRVHIDKVLAFDTMQGQYTETHPRVVQLLKVVKENDERRRGEMLREEEGETCDLKDETGEMLREEEEETCDLKDDNCLQDKKKATEMHGAAVLSNNDILDLNILIVNDPKCNGDDKSRNRLPIKKREGRLSLQTDSDAVRVKSESIFSENIPTGENDSDTDTEWSEPLRKAVLDFEHVESKGDNVSAARQSEAKKRDQYPPKKRRKYVDHETGDVPYTKVAPVSDLEKTSNNGPCTHPVTRTSGRRKSSRPLKLESRRATRTLHAAEKKVSSAKRRTSKKASKSVTICTQTTEVPDECALPGEDGFLEERKLKLENGLDPAPRKRRGRKPGGTIHQCGKCHRSFTTPSALRHHMKGHGSETPFLCEVCGFATIHFASINVHKKQHNGNKFRCTFQGCTYTSIRRSRLEDHMNAHEGIKNFVCSICGKAFAGRKHMQRHEKIHDDLKPVSCEECDYRTTRKDKLRDHIKRHHTATAVLRGYMRACDADKMRTPRRRDPAKRVAPRVDNVARSPPQHQMVPGAVSGATHMVGASTISDDMIQYLTGLAASQLQQQQLQLQQQQQVLFTPTMLAVPQISDSTAVATRQVTVNTVTEVTPDAPAAHSNVQPSLVHTPQPHVLAQPTEAQTPQAQVQTSQHILQVPHSLVQVSQSMVRTALSQLQVPLPGQVTPEPSPQQSNQVVPQPIEVAPLQTHVTQQQAPWLYTLQQSQYSPYQQLRGLLMPTSPSPVAPDSFKHDPS